MATTNPLQVAPHGSIVQASILALTLLCGFSGAQGLLFTPPPPDPQYESVPLPPPETIAAPSGSESVLELDATPVEEIVSPPNWYQPVYWIGPGDWESAVEMGLNGTSGTNDTLSLRTGGYFKGKNDYRKIDASLYYNGTNSEGVQTQANALLSARHDWLLGKSPWSIYVLTQLFYDEFQVYDLDLNVNSGFGYQWIDRESLKLSTQVGAGASREFGGEDDHWAPEAQVGFDYEQTIFGGHKLTAGVDYFPEFENFSRYRILSELAWEAQLSQPENISLKIAATNRYDADPADTEQSVLNYSVLLMWKL
jgi:putative salt-induced outer membrane protein YdiY